MLKTYPSSVLETLVHNTTQRNSLGLDQNRQPVSTVQRGPDVLQDLLGGDRALLS
jgi:hypothetical protein